MTQQTTVVSEMRFGQAINQALIDEMDADPTVVVFGEDVGAAGGSFGVSRGLQARFGESRVRDTPISEAAIVGAAVGAAMSGLRPVVEIMFMDFITLAMDALVNQAAKANFMFGGRFTVPMVLRTQGGAGQKIGVSELPIRQLQTRARGQSAEQRRKQRVSQRCPGSGGPRPVRAPGH